ncbi:MAG: hypothetical protein H6739_20750 [Alphaproteobacteria bacterium]|nr:hypothetical protein [Alphaproteobacteria bacterium]
MRHDMGGLGDEGITQGDANTLREAVRFFQHRIVERDAWNEYLAWAAVFADALDRIERGFRWTASLPVPPGVASAPLVLGFLRAEDWQRFMPWWVGEAAVLCRDAVW